MSTIQSLVSNVMLGNNPLRLLKDFLDKQYQLQSAGIKQDYRFIGYVLDLGYDSAKIITSDPYKIAVGGIPRGSFLILALDERDEQGNPIQNGLPPHFTLLRVKSVSSTPLSNQVQQTYFELHKKSMPELDVWTQAELQWGALECDVIGMFYPNPFDNSLVEFSGDVNNVVSAHKYKVFSPDKDLLDLIINGLVNKTNQQHLGVFRPTECQIGSTNTNYPDMYISIEDFKGRRTAMFGKTRLGKSNVVKVLADAMIQTSLTNQSVGQLIFDINGEYANDNPQDGNRSLATAHPTECIVYALNPRNPNFRELKLNFAEQPVSALPIIKSFLERDNQTSNYIKSFANVELPSLDTVNSESDRGKKIRLIRKIQMFWAILKSAGFKMDEAKLSALNLSSGQITKFNPGLKKDLRNAIYNGSAPSSPTNLNELVNELKLLSSYIQNNKNSSLLMGSTEPLFDQDAHALLYFLNPSSGSGPQILTSYRQYHSPNAGDFINEIIQLLNTGKTVILDLGNAAQEVRQYFSDMLSKAVFAAQEDKFVSNALGNHFIQLYFEEAHNLFPNSNKENDTVYHRFAKEGAKFHIGMVYSTQSPSTISQELLVQTENFFVGHLASTNEANALSKLQHTFSGLEEDIKKSRTPGYMRILTNSHRFVIPAQVKKFTV
ncbi:helicase HerA domain-containing protein [Sporosarcina contaminans]|uniref:Helicase HerA domain-containing protein n=1 Tax=Sporosarcina contaminans TaxID=633403 RepID=A0ABW3TTE7_9BACL